MLSIKAFSLMLGFEAFQAMTESPSEKKDELHSNRSEQYSLDESERFKSDFNSAWQTWIDS